MGNSKPSSSIFFILLIFIALLAFSHIVVAESQGVNPSDKPASFNSSHSQQSSSQKSSGKALGSISSSISGSASVSNYKYENMLNESLNQINPNLLILSIPEANLNDPEIKKICSEMHYPDLCESTIAPFVDGRHDLVAISEFALEACMYNTRLAIVVAKKSSTSPIFARVTSRFNDIIGFYTNALKKLKKAAKDIKVGDLSVYTTINEALKGYRAYEDKWGEPSPMSNFDSILTHMAYNCQHICNLADIASNR